jgi:hypothetical protein
MSNIERGVDLFAETVRQRDLLVIFLTELSRAELLWPGPNGWSAKDYVAHLSEWEQMLLQWYAASAGGGSPAVPAEGFTWAAMDQLNERIYEQHRDDPLERVMASWRESSRRFAEFVRTRSDEELFDVGRLPWTGEDDLATYVFECGANHYRWAAEEIRLAVKAGA